MKIGKATVPESAICTYDEETIVVRGADLCEDLIGKLGFVDYFHFLVTGLYAVLERFADSGKSSMSPLIANVPVDMRHVPKDYPQTVFPNPKLEEDELGQFKSILAGQEETLNSYGWVDEKAGVARIPIDRAMDLLAQRGLPARSQSASPVSVVANRKGTKQ